MLIALPLTVGKISAVKVESRRDGRTTKNSVVPTGLKRLVFRSYPAINRWAIYIDSYGTIVLIFGF